MTDTGIHTEDKTLKFTLKLSFSKSLAVYSSSCRDDQARISLIKKILKTWSFCHLTMLTA